MDPRTRTLLQVQVDPQSGDIQLVDDLMGRRPELRLAFIQANARLVEDLDV
jgi:topoisomerase-4 subunit B